jgi:hypothetical protein
MAKKNYRYKGLTFPIKDDENAIFTVKYISDGNYGDTVINIPGPDDPEILDAGSISIGKGSDLRPDTVFVISEISNPVPEEDSIKVEYYINDKLLQAHSNLKTESKQIRIILFIKFPSE